MICNNEASVLTEAKKDQKMMETEGNTPFFLEFWWFGREPAYDLSPFFPALS